MCKEHGKIENSAVVVSLLINELILHCQITLIKANEKQRAFFFQVVICIVTISGSYTLQVFHPSYS